MREIRRKTWLSAAGAEIFGPRFCRSALTPIRRNVQIREHGRDFRAMQRQRIRGVGGRHEVALHSLYSLMHLFPLVLFVLCRVRCIDDCCVHDRSVGNLHTISPQPGSWHLPPQQGQLATKLRIATESSLPELCLRMPDRHSPSRGCGLAVRAAERIRDSLHQRGGQDLLRHLRDQSGCPCLVCRDEMARLVFRKRAAA